MENYAIGSLGSPAWNCSSQNLSACVLLTKVFLSLTSPLVVPMENANIVDLSLSYINKQCLSLPVYHVSEEFQPSNLLER